ncbi:MAG: DUF1059 domain-containing protein [Nanoarchaeota archaeon]
MTARKVADCRDFPSKPQCTLTVAGTEKEVMEVAIWHAVKKHGLKDTKELRQEIKSMLKDE